jgi:guanine deaminase
MTAACLNLRMTPDEALTAVTINAALALGLADEIGSLEAGKRADLVLLRRDSIAWAALNDPYVQLVFTENGGSVDRVFIEGVEVVADGHATRVDETALFREVDAARRALEPAVEAARETVAPLADPIFAMGRALRDARLDDVEPEQPFR